MRRFVPLLRLVPVGLVLPLALQAAEPRPPARIAAELCAGCHGPNLIGGTAPNLLDTIWNHGSDDATILKGIRDGYPTTGMPPFAAQLSEAELNAFVPYLRAQSRRFAFGQIASLPPPDSIEIKSEKQNFRLETYVGPLDTPWGMVFLPNGDMLISDRIGQIRTVAAGKLLPEAIRDTPKPFVRQDGGFLDITIHPDFAKNGWIYLAYTEAGEAANTTMTRIVRGQIRNGAWVEQQDIFRANQEFYYVAYDHYGCRFRWDKEGHLFFTIGERGKATDAQDLHTPNGKIHRIFDDGRVPPDNPFVKQAGAYPSIWSYGHRNPQGLQFHPTTGKLWATEHGPVGGDEINRIEPGKNYGWPIISYGKAQGREIIEGTAREGLEQPLAYYTPSIAPSGIEFYSGNRYPRWENDLFVGFLFGRQLRRIETDGDKVVHQEVIFSEMGRVRNVIQGPDGLLYVALNNPGRIVRLVPLESMSTGAANAPAPGAKK